MRECWLAECSSNAQYGNPLSGLGSQCKGGTSCHLLSSSKLPPSPFHSLGSSEDAFDTAPSAARSTVWDSTQCETSSCDQCGLKLKSLRSERAGPGIKGLTLTNFQILYLLSGALGYSVLHDKSLENCSDHDRHRSLALSCAAQRCFDRPLKGCTPRRY